MKSAVVPLVVASTTKPSKPSIGTKEKILRAATKIFARDGFDGGRVETISKAAKSYDRMIYYYFGSKQGLFEAVLEEAYRKFNEAEEKLSIDPSQPGKAFETIVRFFLGYYRKNPEFVALLNSENQHKGKTISQSAQMRQYSSPVMTLLERILEEGQKAGEFRPGLAAMDMWLLMASVGYFPQSNRFTLATFLGEDHANGAGGVRWDDFVVDAFMRVVAAD